MPWLLTGRIRVAPLLWLMCFVCVQPAYSATVFVDEPSRQPLSDRFAILVNKEAPLTLDQARERAAAGDFRPARRGAATATNFGLQRGEVWLRLELSVRVENPERWLLEVAHPSLDLVDLYLAESGGEFVHQRAGDQVAFNERPVPHRNHLFQLPLETDRTYELFLRVQSEGTLTVPVTLWSADALWENDQSAYAALSVYYGLLLGLLVYNLFLYLSLRDPLYLIYVVFLGSLAFGLAGLAGLVGQFLFPNQATLTSVSPAAVALSGVFGALFAMRFLGDTPRRVGMQWFMPLMSVGYGLTFICYAFVSYRLGALGVNILSLVFSSGALILGLLSLYHRQPGARFFVLAWAALLAGVVVISLHNLGVIPSNVATANALLIGSGLEMLLLSLALADRINDLQRARDHAHEALLETRAELLAAEREHARELETRVVARTRELEQANTQLSESQRLLEYQAGHDSLTGLVNRNLLNERLAAACARSRRSGQGFLMLLADLDRFKAINDRLGHAAGDEVLVRIAQRLRRAFRDTDTVARFGGDEFVLVLESAEALGAPDVVVRKLQDAITGPVTLGTGETLHVAVSVGVARYPEDARDLAQLFMLADQAMYRQKGVA